MKTWLRSARPAAHHRFIGSVVTASLFVRVTAAAQTAIWQPGSAASWNTPSRWSTGSTPGAATNATIAYAGTVELTTGSGTANSLTIGDSTGAGTLTLNGNSTLTIGGGHGTITLGASGTGAGTLNIGAPAGSAAASPATIFAGVITGGPGTGAKLLNFNHTANNYPFAPMLSGSLSVAHNGSPTSRTTLTAANTYTGNTAINAGTLVLTNTTASPTFTIASGAALEINVASDTRNNPASTTFTGGGNLVKTGEGTLRWDNSVVTFALGAGSMIDVQAGTLVGGSFGNDVWTDNLSNLNVAAGATFTGSQANVRVAALTGGGTISSGYIGAGYTAFTFGLNNASGTFSGALINYIYPELTTAAGNFVKTGTGTQILSGANTYTGTTTISGGTLQIGNGGTTGSLLSSGITNNAALVFDRSTASAFAGTISGSGTLAKLGAGTLTLSGEHTYSGNTTIAAGTLALQNTTRSPFFAIASGATLEMNVASGERIGLADTTFTGTGTFVKTGAGELRWNERIVTFALGAGSMIDVQAGTLVAAGSGNDGWTNNLSNLNIAAGATLLGSQANVRVAALTGAGLVRSGYIGAGYTDFTFGLNDASGTFSGVLADFIYPETTIGAGHFTKAGTGTQILSGANTYTGTTTINGGTLQIGDGGTAGSLLSSAIVNQAALVFNRSDASTYSGDVSGSGTLTKHGAGTLTLTGNHTYTGDTTISDGTLQIGGGGAVGSFASSVITNHAALAFNHSNDANYDGIISGTGSLTKLGTGTLILSGANDYTGTTTVSEGTLQIGNGGANGSLSGSTITNHAALVFNHSGAATQAGTISGSGTLQKLGTGTLTLSGANHYTGTTTISAGTLQFATQTALYNNAVANWTATKLIVAAGATAAFNVGGAGEFTAANLNTIKGLGTATGGFRNGSFLGIDTTNANGGSFTYGSAIANPNGGTNSFGLIKLGTGTLILNGPLTYTGGTTVQAGTLQLGAYNGIPAGNFTVNSGGTLTFQTFDLFGSHAVTINTRVTINAGGLVTNAAGANAFNTLQDLTLNGGTLRAAAGKNSSYPSFQLRGTVTVGGSVASSITTTGAANSQIQIGNNLDKGTTVFDVADVTNDASADLSISAVLQNGRSGSEQLVASGLTKTGAGTLALNATNTYTGTTTINQGTLSLGVANALNSSPLEISEHGTLSFGAISAASITSLSGSGMISLINSSDNSVALTVGSNNTNTTFSGVISGTGSLIKTGTGTLTLSGTNTYSGGTTISGGLIDFRSRDQFGAGSLTLNGGGLRWATGTTTDVSDWISPLGANGGTFNTNGNNVTFAHALSGAGRLTKTGDGTLILTGTNIHSGGTTISAGALQLGNGGSTGSVVGAITNNGELIIDRSDDFTLTNLISGSGSLTKNGHNTVTLDAANTFAGATRLNTGILVLGRAAALGQSTLDLADTGTLSFGSFTAATLGGLRGAGTLSLVNDTSAAVALTVGANHASTTYSGVLSGSGSLNKTGTGTLTLTGPNTYSGGTTVTGGLIEFSSGAQFGSGPITLDGGGLRWATGTTTNVASVLNALGNSGGTFDTNGNNLTLDYTLTGSGDFTKAGNGTLAVTAAQTYSGATRVTGGILHLGAGSSLGQNMIVLDGGSLTFAPSFTEYSLSNLSGTGGNLSLTNSGGGAVSLHVGTNNANASFSGVLTGSGSLVKTGSGTLTLASNQTYTGTTVINGGTLRLANSGSLYNYGNSGGSITINDGGTLELARNEVFQNASDAPLLLTVNAGGRITNNSTYNTLRNLNLDGGELRASGGSSNGAYQLQGTITVSGSTASSITASSASNSSIHLDAYSSLGTTFAVADVTGDARSDLTISAVIRDPNSYYYPSHLIKTGLGTLTLAANNTYSGNTTISEGILQVGNGGTSGSLSSSIINNAAIIFNRSNSSSYTQTISGSGTLTKTGDGILTLSANQTYRGITTINAGTLRLANGSSLYNNGTEIGSIIVNSGGTLSFARGNTFGVHSAPVPQVSITINAGGLVTNEGFAAFNTLNNLKLNGGTLHAAGAESSSYGAYQLKGTVTVDGSTASSITTNGATNVNIQLGDNTNTGVTTFAVSDVTHNASSDLTISARLSDGRNGNGDIVSSGLTKTGEGTLTLSAANSYTGTTTVAEGTVQIGNGSGTGSVTGNIVNHATLAFNRTGSSTHANTISGTGSLIQLGSGAITLSGANSYSGGTVVSTGTLVAGHASALGTGAVRINGGTLNLANLNVANALDVHGGSLIGLANYTGTQTLSTAMSYSGSVGGTTIVANGGALNTTGATFTGATTVNAGGSLGGSGSLATLTLNSGATLAPGNSPGTLTITGDTTWHGGVAYEWEINDATGAAGIAYDLVSISGVLTILATAENKFTLSLVSLLANNTAGDVFNFNAAQNYAYTIASASGGVIGFDANAFTLDTSGFANDLAGGTWSLAQSGNTLALNFTAAAIPEPSTYAAILGALILGLTIYRKRPHR